MPEIFIVRAEGGASQLPSRAKYRATNPLDAWLQQLVGWVWSVWAI